MAYRTILSISISVFFILSVIVETVFAQSPLLPDKLAIYYGFPSLINGAEGDPLAATEQFRLYDLVVFGDGLQLPDCNEVADGMQGVNCHLDHTNTVAIINQLKTPPNDTSIYGYIPIGVTNLPAGQAPLPIQEIKERVDAWREMGVAGVFLDQAGCDFGVTRQRQNEVLDYVHGKGLNVFIDAWDPDDVFSPALDSICNPNALETRLGSNDFFLHESFQIEESKYQDPAFWMSKSDKALEYKNQYGTRMATVTTVSKDVPNFDQDKFDYAWWSTLLYGFDAMGWGELYFSASDSNLSYRPRPNPGEIGSAFISPIIYDPPVNRRKTTAVLIEVNTEMHAGKARLCLAVTKEAEPAGVQSGSPLTYTIRVTNTSNMTLTAIITDILPSQVIPSDVLTWAPTISASGGNWTEQLIVTVEAGYTGTLLNVIEVTTQEGPIARARSIVCANVCVIYLPTILKNGPSSP
jgi:uncharacterized repeat protein (TIGR01451 family)